MTNDTIARCGLDCGTCDYRAKTGCPGCRQSQGKMFWGQCQVAQCSIDRSLEHCGQCSAFACPTLHAFAYDKEHGDNGKRLENLRALR